MWYEDWSVFLAAFVLCGLFLIATGCAVVPPVAGVVSGAVTHSRLVPLEKKELRIKGLEWRVKALEREAELWTH